MKRLVDMNLSPRGREALRAHGYEALWWGDVGPPDADEVLFAWARASGYSILTADLDFSRLLALTGDQGPSVLLLRLASRNLRRPWARFWKPFHGLARPWRKGPSSWLGPMASASFPL